jgi:nitrile hydratase accessory protein
MTASPETVRAAAAALGEAAPPMVDGEPVFAEPWEGRAYGLALDLVERRGLPWEAFRSRLIEAIAESADRPYFESWVIALERLAATTGVTTDDLHHERVESAAYHYVQDGVPIEVTPLAMAADELRSALDEPFGDEGHAQTEMYRLAPAGVDDAADFGVRAFDSTGVIVTDMRFEADRWRAARDRLLAFAG